MNPTPPTTERLLNFDEAPTTHNNAPPASRWNYAIPVCGGVCFVTMLVSGAIYLDTSDERVKKALVISGAGYGATVALAFGVTMAKVCRNAGSRWATLKESFQRCTPEGLLGNTLLPVTFCCRVKCPEEKRPSSA